MTGSEAEKMDLSAAAVGEVLRRETVHISREDLVAYAYASGDQNPIHQDEQVARGVGLPDVIAHGMLTMGLVGSQIEAVAQGRQILSFGTRFAAPVAVPADGGADVLIEMKLQARDEQARSVTLEALVSVEGTKVLSRTRAVIQLD